MKDILSIFCQALPLAVLGGGDARQDVGQLAHLEEILAVAGAGAVGAQAHVDAVLGVVGERRDAAARVQGRRLQLNAMFESSLSHHGFKR